MKRTLYRPLFRPLSRSLFYAGGVFDDIISRNSLIIDSSVPSSNRPIQPGYALSFDGVDDYATTTVSTATGKIACWLNTTDNDGCFIGSQVGDQRCYLQVRGGVLGGGLGSLTYLTMFGTTTINDGQWHYVEMRWDATDVSLWVDGVQEYTTAKSGVENTVTTVYLGCLNSSGSPTAFLNCQLFDVSVGVSRYPIVASSGTTIYDASGNAVHGSLVNGSSWVIYNSIPYSYPNQEGYTLGTGSNGAALGVIIPSDDSNPGFDVLGNTLDYSGSAFPIPPVKRNSYAGVFDGVDDYAITTITPNISGYIEVLFKPTALNVVQIITGARDSTDTRCYLGISADNKLGGGVGALGMGANEIKSVTTLQTGVYYRGRVEWDGLTVRLYLNGVLEYEEAQSGSVGVSEEFHIGGLNDAGTNDFRFTGDIAYVDIQDEGFFPMSSGIGSTIYNTAVSDDIARVVNASTSTTGTGFWAGSQDVYHHNHDVGFSFYPRFTSQVAGYTNYAFAVEQLKGDFVLTLPDFPNNNGVRFFGIKLGSYPTPTPNVSPTILDASWQYFNNNVQAWSDGSLKVGVTASTGQSLTIERVGTLLILKRAGSTIHTFNAGVTDDAYVVIGSSEASRTIDAIYSDQTRFTWTNITNMVLSNPKRYPGDDSGLDVFGFPVTNPSVDSDNNSETILDIYNVAEGDIPSPESFHLFNFDTITFSNTSESLRNQVPVETVFRSDVSNVQKGTLYAFSDSLTSPNGDMFFNEITYNPSTYPHRHDDSES